MRTLAFVLLLAGAASTPAQEREIHRALVQRDQMTAEFAAQLHGASNPRDLELLHARQLGETQLPLSGDPALAEQLLPYQRARMEQERGVLLQFAPPVVRKSVSDTDIAEPLALPGRPRAGVDAVAPHGLGR